MFFSQILTPHRFKQKVCPSQRTAAVVSLNSCWHDHGFQSWQFLIFTNYHVYHTNLHSHFWNQCFEKCERRDVVQLLFSWMSWGSTIWNILRLQVIRSVHSPKWSHVCFNLNEWGHFYQNSSTHSLQLETKSLDVNRCERENVFTFNHGNS